MPAGAFLAAALVFTLHDIPRAYPTINGPQHIQVADLDLDGNVDIVTDGVPYGAILYGRGDGTFEAPVPLGQGPKTAHVAYTVVTDVDRDGLSDLVLTTTDPYGTLIRHNNGQRRFDERTLSDKYASSLAAADFNGDGIPEILLYNPGLARLLVNGIERTLPGAPNALPAIGDFDGDGDLDLAMKSGMLQIFANNGNAQFSGSTVIDEIAIPAAADLDGDRRADVVALRYATGEVAVRTAANLAATSAVVLAGSGPSTAAFGDFNGDGALDVAVLNNGTAFSVDPNPTITTYYGDGRGGLTVASKIAVPGSSQGMATADVNHDGALDLIVSAPFTAGVVLGNGDGTFRVPPAVSGFPTTRLGAAGDLDGDGIDEILVGRSTSMLYAGWMNADGTYRFDPVPVVNAGVDSPLAMTTGKLVVAEGSVIHVLTAKAPGQWSDVTIDAGATIDALRTWPDRIAVTTTASDATLKVFSMAGALLHSYSQPRNGNVRRLHAADVDRDGLIDLIVTALGSASGGPLHPNYYSPDGYVQLFRGRPDGTFAPPELIAAGRQITDGAVADFNNDGAVDVEVQAATPGLGAGRFWVTFYGDGAGHFLERAESLALIPELVADLNYDGRSTSWAATRSRSARAAAPR